MSLDILLFIQQEQPYKCMMMNICMCSGNAKEFDVTEVLITVCGNDGL